MELTTTQSESISNICAALAKAQGAFKPIVKNRTVCVTPRKRPDGYQPPPYTFIYATLDSVIDATREALSANGLCHTAMVSGGQIVVKLLHSSGEYFAAAVPVPPATSGWQEFGSAITYARRYLLTPLLGVASEEDDDGNAAEGNQVSDPFQKLWDAMDAKTSIGKDGNARRIWCEMVLGRAIASANDLRPTDLPVLLAALAKDTAKPEPAKPAPASTPKAASPGKEDLAKELNAALNALSPWGSAIDGKSAKDAATIKQAAKLTWANAMKGGKKVTGFSELSTEELIGLIAKAKAGEVPGDAELPEWMEETPGASSSEDE